jgi:hypothetical protein
VSPAIAGTFCVPFGPRQGRTIEQVADSPEGLAYLRQLQMVLECSKQAHLPVFTKALSIFLSTK